MAVFVIVVVCSQRRNISKGVGCFIFDFLILEKVSTAAQECVWSTLASSMRPAEPDCTGTCPRVKP